MIISSYRFSFTCMIQSKVQFPFFRVDYLCPRFSITRVTLWIHCSKVQVIYISRWIIIRISRFSKLNFLCDFYIVIDIALFILCYTLARITFDHIQIYVRVFIRFRMCVCTKYRTFHFDIYFVSIFSMHSFVSSSKDMLKREVFFNFNWRKWTKQFFLFFCLSCIVRFLENKIRFKSLILNVD